MEAHPHAHRTGGEPVTGRARGVCRSCSGREGDEERVALRVDLGAAVLRGRFANDPPVLGERVGVPRGAELVQQPRRAFDVGEEERDRSLGKRAHDQMMNVAATRD